LTSSVSGITCIFRKNSSSPDLAFERKITILDFHDIDGVFSPPKMETQISKKVMKNENIVWV
jgi:hypothetical protein